MPKVSSYPNPALRGWHFNGGTPEPNAWYRFCRRGLHVVMGLFWRVRVFNRHFEPTSGSAVYVSNHQSFLDPILISYSLSRHMNFMARDTLFRSKYFARLISSVYAFPVKRGTADLAAIKEAMRRLKNGEQVVLFAEGTRTEDGKIGKILPGVAMLSQRTAEWTVPVVIDGAFECWPRHQALPGLGSIAVQYGRPIPQSELRKCTSEQVTQRLHSELVDLQADLRKRLGRPALKYD